VVPALAMWLFARSVGHALAALEGLSVGTGGTLGTMQVTVAILLSLATCQLGPSARTRERLLTDNALQRTGLRPAAERGR